MTLPTHTVEKIGGTSMSRVAELLDTLFIGDRTGAALYGRVFVVSAFGGITNLLLEHKKSGQPGVYARFANGDDDHGWLDALTEVGRAMRAAHGDILDNPGDRSMADEFVRERIEGARSCLFDLQRLCSYGHFRLGDHMMVIRELLSGLGEAHSAFVTTLLLQRAGVNARFIDLSGWRDETEHSLAERIAQGLHDVDLSTEMPIVTGYAQCSEGLMREFDRGYSEVTFARIAAHTGAREAIIHKEFHLSSADPKLVGEGAVRKLGHTNYDVADQLSNLGMEAIHQSGQDAATGGGAVARDQRVRSGRSRHAHRRSADGYTGGGDRDRPQGRGARALRAGHGGRQGLRFGHSRGAQAAQCLDRVKNLERQHDHALRAGVVENGAARGPRS
jgi:aspartate kinase